MNIISYVKSFSSQSQPQAPVSVHPPTPDDHTTYTPPQSPNQPTTSPPLPTTPPYTSNTPPEVSPAATSHVNSPHPFSPPSPAHPASHSSGTPPPPPGQSSDPGPPSPRSRHRRRSTPHQRCVSALPHHQGGPSPGGMVCPPVPSQCRSISCRRRAWDYALLPSGRSGS